MLHAILVETQAEPQGLERLHAERAAGSAPPAMMWVLNRSMSVGHSENRWP